MDDEEVLAAAADDGFVLVERRLPGADHDVWGWRRGDDDRWPCFGDRELAVSWMADRLHRRAVFE